MIDIIFNVRFDYIKDPLILFSDHRTLIILTLNHFLNNALKLVVIARRLPLDQVVFDDLTLKYLIR